MRKALLMMHISAVIFGTVQHAVGQQAIISLDEVAVYPLPLVDETPAAVLSKGDTVRVIGQRGNWVKIAYTGNSRGWMLIEVEKPPRSESDVLSGQASPGDPQDGGQGSDAGKSYVSAANPDRIVRAAEAELVEHRGPEGHHRHEDRRDPGHHPLQSAPGLQIERDNNQRQCGQGLIDGTKKRP